MTNNEPKPHLVKCILKVSPHNVDFRTSDRPIIAESTKDYTFSIPDPLELKNQDRVSKDRVGKPNQVMHFLEDSLLTVTGLCMPDGIEALRSLMWQTVVKSCTSHMDEIDKRRDKLLAMVMSAPTKYTTTH